MSKTALIDYWSQEFYLAVEDSIFRVVYRDLARIGELWLDCPWSANSPSIGRVLHVVSSATFGAQGLN